MNELINQQRDQIAQLTDERDALAARLSEIEKSDGQVVLSLKADNQALVAQVEALGDKLSEVVALLNVDGMTAVQWLLDNCPEIESLTDIEPEEHLAELRAEAWNLGFDCCDDLISKNHDAWYYEEGFNDLKSDAAKQYADSIRNGGAE